MAFIIAALDSETVGKIWAEVVGIPLFFFIVLMAFRKKTSGWNVAGAIAALLLLGNLARMNSSPFIFIGAFISIIFFILLKVFKKTGPIIITVLISISIITVLVGVGLVAAIDRANEIKYEQNLHIIQSPTRTFTIMLPDDFKESSEHPQINLYARNQNLSVAIFHEPEIYSENVVQELKEIYHAQLKNINFSPDRIVKINGQEWTVFSSEQIQENITYTDLYYLYSGEKEGTAQIIFTTTTKDFSKLLSLCQKIAQTFRFVNENQTDESVNDQ